ncbi:MAG: creatininase family protein [Solirubrobacterales bacterium]|nr:creatininase family protein [Solirubrobacterales bacterium]OJU95902.1 MAG: hypothetical protein BGO23_10010 [Solirubrobacterales bacterium 67-14]
MAAVEDSSGSRRAVDFDWFQLTARLRDRMPLVLPVGSTEQHGPHLPLSTDAVIAEALADGISRGVGGAVLPTITYGAPSRPRSGGGDLFASPDVSLPTLLETVESVVRRSLEAGAKTIIVVSWHWENASVLWDSLRAAHQGQDPEARSILFASPWDLMGVAETNELLGEGGADGFDWAADHAGLLETAIMLHLEPELVTDAPAAVEFRPRQYEVLPTPVDSVPATGVVHDARRVTAEQGAACFDSMVAGLVQAVLDETGD